MELGRYRVLRKLGEGGMAQVLLAATTTGATVVLKVPFSRNPDFAERLRDEARVGLRLAHPAVVETLDLFEHEGRPILVVEYVDGPSLAQLRRRVGPMPPSIVARVGRQVAEGLEAIHAATDEYDRPLNILHRDVTPGNILVTPEGNAKLIDLGIARGLETKSRRTQIGAVRGTMRYLAPELLDGMKHSPSTDLWALGVVLFEAALGRRAVEGDERLVLAAIVRGSITELRPGEVLNPRLETGIRALLSPAETRLQRALAAANILGRIEEQMGPPPEPVLERIRRLTRDIADESKKTPIPIHIEPAGPSLADAPAPITMETAAAVDDLQPFDDGEEESRTLPVLQEISDSNNIKATVQMPAVSMPPAAFRDDQRRPTPEEMNEDPEAPTLMMEAVREEDLPALADDDEDADATVAESGPPSAMPAPMIPSPPMPAATVLEQPAFISDEDGRAATVQDLRLPAALRAALDSPLTDSTLQLPVPGDADQEPAPAPEIPAPAPAPAPFPSGPQTQAFPIPGLAEDPGAPAAGPKPKSTLQIPVPAPSQLAPATAFPSGPSTQMLPQPGFAGAGAELETPAPVPAPSAAPLPAHANTDQLPMPEQNLVTEPSAGVAPVLAPGQQITPSPAPPSAAAPEVSAIPATPPTGAMGGPAAPPTPDPDLTSRIRRRNNEPLAPEELAFKKSSAALIFIGAGVFLFCLVAFLAIVFLVFGFGPREPIVIDDLPEVPAAPGPDEDPDEPDE